MSLAITDDHRALAETAADFLTSATPRGHVRRLSTAPMRPCPSSGAS